ncbi:DNA adenine methylase [Nonomuraea guangzhouensis]|uniref:DNA adenine methylase n=1 Tax=Nonomuraea guangzhouensis TaxID=1291555 RepID=A0ABW4GGR8_9ACTN|nr:DNA adenine methylase [Nonomuraea guangzhouensis]
MAIDDQTRPVDAPRPRVGRNAELRSPLRYPGGKRQLVPFFVDLLKLNGKSPLDLFIEPFAGGAAVSLHLLAAGLVERVVLADLDPLVYAFWHQACFRTEQLVADIAAADVTLAEWHKLRAAPGKTLREKAYACLFLNRTSYSGILQGRAGPIGGQKQQSKYKIDCRFYKDEIIHRLRQLGELAADGRIAAVRRTDVRATVRWVEETYSQTQRLYYFDPPFWEKGERLYRKAFGHADHKRLAKLLIGLQAPWALSYDYHEEIVDLYRASVQAGGGGHSDLVPVGKPRLHTADLLYCNRHEKRGATELIITNLADVPSEHVNAT